MRLRFVRPDGETYTFAPLESSPGRGVWAWEEDDTSGKRDFTVRELVEALVQMEPGELWVGSGEYSLHLEPGEPGLLVDEGEMRAWLVANRAP